MTTPVRVALADDNTVIRRGVRALVEALPSLEFVGEAADGQAAVDLVRDQAPDVLLLDVRMPVRDGVSVVGEVAATTPVLIVLVGGMVLVLAMLFMFVLPVTRGADQTSRSQTATDSAALAGAEAIREDVLARLAVGDLGILAGPWASRGGHVVRVPQRR